MKKNKLQIIIVLALFSYVLHAQTDEQQTFKKLYLQQVAKNAEFEAKTNLSLIAKTQNIDTETHNALYQLFYTKRLETEKIVMSEATTEKTNKDLENLFIKYDSVNNLYLQALKSKSIVGTKILNMKENSKFAHAIKNSNQLQLNKKQIDDLFFQTGLMSDKKVANPDLNLKEYERSQLPAILTDKQYIELLVILNKTKALNWAKKSWEEMKSREINQSLDSTKVIAENYNYNLYKLVSRDRYGDHTVEASENLQKMINDMPDSALQLASDKARNPIKKEETLKTNFSW